MRHLEILEKIKSEMQKDSNIISLLVFGSVAKGNHHENSDIDTIAVYKEFKDGYKFTTGWLDEIKVGTSCWSLKELERNVCMVPYLMYVFGTAQILFDTDFFVESLQFKVLKYLAVHNEVEMAWKKHHDMYEEEKKKFGSGKISIIDVLDELEKRFSGGEIKRTFLLR